MQTRQRLSFYLYFKNFAFHSPQKKLFTKHHLYQRISLLVRSDAGNHKFSLSNVNIFRTNQTNIISQKNGEKFFFLLKTRIITVNYHSYYPPHNFDHNYWAQTQKNIYRFSLSLAHFSFLGKYGL